MSIKMHFNKHKNEFTCKMIQPKIVYNKISDEMIDYMLQYDLI